MYFKFCVMMTLIELCMFKIVWMTVTYYSVMVSETKMKLNILLNRSCQPVDFKLVQLLHSWTKSHTLLMILVCVQVGKHYVFSTLEYFLSCHLSQIFQMYIIITSVEIHTITTISITLICFEDLEARAVWKKNMFVCLWFVCMQVCVWLFVWCV